MKLTVLGATGGVGRHVVSQALDAGHEVTVVVRRAEGLPGGVRVVVTDLTSPDRAALEGAVAGADAVISCVGPRSKAHAATRVTTVATAAIVAAMERAGSSRLLLISAAPVSTFPSPERSSVPRVDPGDDWLTGRVLYPLIKAALKPVYQDLAATEDVVRASGLEWSVVRPPQLVDGGLTGVYRVDAERNLPRGRKISRADLAHWLLSAAESGADVGREVRIAY